MLSAGSDADYRLLEARLSPFRSTAAIFTRGETRYDARHVYHTLLELATAQPSFLILDPLLEPESSSSTREEQRQRQPHKQRDNDNAEWPTSTCGAPEQQTLFVNEYLLAAPTIERPAAPPLVPDTDPRTLYGLDMRTSADANALYSAYVKVQECATNSKLQEKTHNSQFVAPGLLTGPGPLPGPVPRPSCECALNLRPASELRPAPTSRDRIKDEEEPLFLPLPLANFGRSENTNGRAGHAEPFSLSTRSEMLSLSLSKPQSSGLSSEVYSKYSTPILVNSDSVCKNSWFFNIRPTNSAIQLYKSYCTYS